MLINFVCWVWIAISAFLFGMVGLKILKKVNGYINEELDMILVFGVCLLTVFAQGFSCFYKVGALANGIVFMADVVILVAFRIDIWRILSKWKKDKQSKWIYVILIFLLLIYLDMASGTVRHYDTYLYHAQSIRWIEEYGVIPGLGNLHNRLAYNSSIFSLQALFSMRFLLGSSLHSVNGFIGLIFVGYSVCSLKVLRTYRFHASDFLRIGVLAFMSQQNDLISSPGSDVFALGLVLYILIKWVSLLEEKEYKVEPYIPLCLMAVFAVSVKLTATMLVLLAVVPAVRLVQQKRWKEIGIYISAGIIVILPFLVRNVLICGYLIYPYPELDFFNFDWEMPSYTLTFDRNEIKAWGWGINDVFRFDAPFSEWFSVWKAGVNKNLLFALYISPIVIVLSCGYGIMQGIKMKKWDYLCVVVAITASFLLWFYGSPLIRYGSIFIPLLPNFFVGSLLEKLNLKISNKNVPIVIILIFTIYHLQPIMHTGMYSEWNNKLVPTDYEVKNYEKQIWENEVIYYPVEGDQTGYWSFPSLPYAARLNLIELRGNDLKDGIRMKEEYRNAFVSTYGVVYEENVFE